jgi:hypothetical protein
MTPGSTSDEGAKSTIWLVMLSCLLFAYAAARAAVVPITWDEAFSYLEFTRKGLLLPFGHFRAMAANNHYLNTWLTYLTTGVLGVSELTLRLPALAAYALFLYYTARLCGELSSPLLRVSAFVVLNGNPYVLDYFSLARGYGLAYGLLAGSLWYLYRFFETGLQVRYSRASLGFAIVAVAAHLTLIHFLISLMLVVVLATMLFAPAGSGLLRRASYALRVNAVGLAAVGLSLVPAMFVIRKLRNVRSFFYGGTSFWHDTVLDVFEASLYEKQYPALLGSWLRTPSFRLSGLLGSLAVLLMAVALWVSIRRVMRHPQPRDLYLPALVMLLCACGLALVAQHHLLGVLYLKRRTGMYLLILGTFVLVMLADVMPRSSRIWRYSLPVVAIIVTLHLMNCLNLTYALEWKLDADVKHMLADIAVARGATPGVERPSVLGVNLEFEAPINFYRRMDGLTWLNPADRRMKLHPLSDFYLYSEGDWEAVAADSFVVLKTYPLNNSRLLRRRTRASRYDVRFEKTLDFDAPADSMTTLETTSEDAAFSGLRSGMTDERHRRSGSISYTPDVARDAAERSLVVVEAMVWMQSLRNATAQVVVAFERDKTPYSWQKLTVQDDARRARTWSPVKLIAFVPPDVRQGDRVSVYLENQRDPVYIDDMEMQWITAVWP